MAFVSVVRDGDLPRVAFSLSLKLPTSSVHGDLAAAAQSEHTSKAWYASLLIWDMVLSAARVPRSTLSLSMVRGARGRVTVALCLVMARSCHVRRGSGLPLGRWRGSIPVSNRNMPRRGCTV